MDKVELLFFCGGKREEEIGSVMNINKSVFVTSDEKIATSFMRFNDVVPLINSMLKGLNFTVCNDIRCLTVLW